MTAPSYTQLSDGVKTKMWANILITALIVFCGWLYIGLEGYGKETEDVIITSVAWVITHPATTIASLALLWVMMMLPYDLPFLNWLYPCWWLIIWSIPILTISAPMIWGIYKTETWIMKKLLEKILIKK